MNNSRIPRTKNVKFSEYYFYLNTNIYREFQICIIVPLSWVLNLKELKHFGLLYLWKLQGRVNLDGNVKRDFNFRVFIISRSSLGACWCRRCIQKPVKHLRWSFRHSLNIWQGSEYPSEHHYLLTKNHRKSL